MIFFLIGIPMTVFFLTDLIDLYELYRYGEKTHATIEEKWKEADENEDGKLMISYYAAYTFDVRDSRDFGGEKELTLEEFRAIKSGDKITVTFLPDDPNLNTPYEDEDLWVSDALAGLSISIFMLVIGISILIHHYQKVLSKIALYYNGNTVHGIITDIEEPPSSRGYFIKVTYEYKDRKGRVHKRTTSPVPTPGNTYTQKIGDNIVIHCHPRHQKNSIWKDELY